MLCCIGGVCVPYTAVVPLLLLVFRWCLAKLATFGLVPESVVKMMNLHEMQQSTSCCSTNATSTTTSTKSSCCNNEATVKELESEEEFTNLLKTGKKVVVKFTASWCKPCKKIQPLYEQLATMYQEQASFVTIDVDDFDNIATKYKIAMMPTFLVLQNEDNVLGTYRGSNEPQLETFLQEQL